MQIVIDIDDEIVQDIIEGDNYEPRNTVKNFQATIAYAIKNGTPLDKIRAEIQATIGEERTGNGNINKGVVIGLQMALDTIDKYKDTPDYEQAYDEYLAEVNKSESEDKK